MLNIIKKSIIRITSTISGAALTLTTIVILFSFPSYDVALLTNEMDPHWDGIFRQVKEPFVNHNHMYAEGSHETKLAFRFIPALILKFFNIDNKIGALTFQFLTLVIFYYLITLIFNQLFKDRLKSFKLALPICFVISGHVYISDYRGIFDTLALVFLLIAIYLRNNIFILIPLLLAYFTDERALIASPGVFLINVILKNKYLNFKELINEFKFNPNLYLFLSWIIYFIIRIYLGFAYKLQTENVGVDLFYQQLNKSLYTFYIGLEGFFIPFGMIVYILLKRKIYIFPFFLVFYFLIIFYVSQSVYDISRSMSYVLILLIILLILLDKLFKEYIFNNVLLTITVINMFSLFSYPLFAQLYRMKFITNSI